MHKLLLVARVWPLMAWWALTSCSPPVGTECGESFCVHSDGEVAVEEGGTLIDAKFYKISGFPSTITVYEGNNPRPGNTDLIEWHQNEKFQYFLGTDALQDTHFLLIKLSSKCFAPNFIRLDWEESTQLHAENIMNAITLTGKCWQE